jgi:hypothetical protein
MKIHTRILKIDDNYFPQVRSFFIWHKIFKYDERYEICSNKDYPIKSLKEATEIISNYLIWRKATKLKVKPEILDNKTTNI